MTIGTELLSQKTNYLIGQVASSEQHALLSKLAKLSKQIISVATLADLPSASANEGRFYYVESVNGYRYSNGVEWTNYGGSIAGVSHNLMTMGSSGYAQLGDMGAAAVYVSSPISTFPDRGFKWKDISVGIDNFMSGVTTDGTLWTWGKNAYGQGAANSVNSWQNSPVSAIGGFTWKAVSAGGYHILMLRDDNTLWSSGANYYGVLGNNGYAKMSSPVSVVGGFTWKATSASKRHNIAIKSDNTLWAWGRNNYGQLGNNSNAGAPSPVSVVGGFTWITCFSGLDHTTAIKSDNTLWAWGRNNYGQLGTNNTSSYSSPVSVVGGFTWKQVAAGEAHTIAIKSDGTLWSWGRNYRGQLGTNNTSSYSSPVSVVGGFTWSQVSSRLRSTIAIKSDGTAWSWGENLEGFLGTNNASSYSSPVSVVGGQYWYSISMGWYNSAGLVASGF